MTGDEGVDLVASGDLNGSGSHIFTGGYMSELKVVENDGRWFVVRIWNDEQIPIDDFDTRAEAIAYKTKLVSRQLMKEAGIL